MAGSTSHINLKIELRRATEEDYPFIYDMTKKKRYGVH
jgi:hypothetical protein